jgi:hypothetical protein
MFTHCVTVCQHPKCYEHAIQSAESRNCVVDEGFMRIQLGCVESSDFNVRAMTNSDVGCDPLELAEVPAGEEQ